MYKSLLKYNDIELNDEYDKEIKEYKFIIQKNLPRFESSRKIKVLVGDYDLMSISNTITVLKSMGIITKAARSGREIIERIKTGEKYDLIILDPPAFAKHRDALKRALIGYRRLNEKALEKIEPGGILFTFSCSQVVTKEQFRMAVFTAAAQAGRSVKILYQLHQPADHPINIFHPEGEYLKGLVLSVE